jgi:hypothetical protein
VVSVEKTITDKSVTLNPEGVPAWLKDLPQWLLWRYEPHPEPEKKPRKVPYQLDGRRASSTDPNTWAPYDAVQEFYLLHQDDFTGLGFVFTEQDPFCGVDLDDCVDPNGTIAPWALEIIKALNTYAEISPSGEGVKLIARAKLPGPNGKHKPYADGAVGLFDHARYFAITNRHLPDTPTTAEERQEEIERLYRSLEKASNLTPCKVESVLSDADVLATAFAASNGHAVRRLFDGHTDGYTSPSEADAALVRYLCFYTGHDRAQLDRLFRLSKLNDEKWETRADYREKTIDLALSGMREFYTGKKPEEEPQLTVECRGFTAIVTHFGTTPSGTNHANFDADFHDGKEPLEYRVTATISNRKELAQELASRLKDGKPGDVNEDLLRILKAAQKDFTNPSRKKIQKTQAELIAEYARNELGSAFREGKEIWTDKRGDFYYLSYFRDEILSDELEALLAQAVDGKPGRDAPDKAFRKAWGILMRTLPEEKDADLGPDSAAARRLFRAVLKLWHTHFTYGLSDVGKRLVSAGMIHCALRAFKDEKCLNHWYQIHENFDAWCRADRPDGQGWVLQLAMRPELFYQIGKPNCPTGGQDYGDFRTLMERYGLGKSVRVGSLNTRAVGIVADLAKELLGSGFQGEREE